jgi:hypothetical protein
MYALSRALQRLTECVVMTSCEARRGFLFIYAFMLELITSSGRWYRPLKSWSSLESRLVIPKIEKETCVYGVLRLACLLHGFVSR